jgi:hypothetical protein
MFAKILKKVTLTVEPGSIVNISEGQFKALRDKAETYKAEAKEELKAKAPKAEEKEEKPKTEPKKAPSKKTSTKKK